MASHREAGKYWFRLPGYSELGEKIVCVCEQNEKCVSRIRTIYF
jgi:hypothetical protein